jgi:hypothetical protein
VLIRGTGASRFIFRSSTNAEDIDGFNAAGLYDSVVLGDKELTKERVASAIKAVWASIWNTRAFLERVVFGISSAHVAMCVLVQPHYADSSLAANGVAATANPFSKDKYGVYITSYPGGSHRATDSSTIRVFRSRPAALALTFFMPSSFECRSNSRADYRSYESSARPFRTRTPASFIWKLRKQSRANDCPIHPAGTKMRRPSLGAPQ